MADANFISVKEQTALLAEASCRALHADCGGRITEPCFACTSAARKQVEALAAAGADIIRVRWSIAGTPAAEDPREDSEPEGSVATMEAVDAHSLLTGYFTWLERQGWIYPPSPLDDPRTRDDLAAEFIDAFRTLTRDLRQQAAD